MTMATETKTPRTVVKTAKNKAGQVIAKLYSDGTILVSDIRISYPHLDAAWAKKEGETKKFSAVGILPTATHQPAIDLCLEHAQDLLKEHNKGKDIADKDIFIRDGKPTKKPEYAGAWTINASETERPTVLHPDKSEMEPSEVKSTIKAGYFTDMLIDPWWQDNEHGKRVNSSLRAVRFRREGPVIAEGGISKDEAISSFDDDDDGGFGGDDAADDENGGL